MLSNLAIVALVVLSAHSPAQAISYAQQSWADSFKALGAPFPKPRDNCQVCFFEQPYYSGSRVCVGPRDPGCDDTLVISAPSTIGSIQFTRPSDNSSECQLVANIRVLDPPYGRHIDSVTHDVNNTQYNDVVQELFVESAGRACFLAAKTINQYGKCYNSSVEAVGQDYEDAFYEVLLFRTKRDEFDLVLYDEPGFSGHHKRVNQSTDDFSVSTPMTESQPIDLQWRIKSIKLEHNVNATESYCRRKKSA